MLNRTAQWTTTVALTIASVGCKGSLLPPTYYHQDILPAPPPADHDDSQPTGAPFRVYPCQSAQTHETRWAPEYAFTGGYNTEVPEAIRQSVSNEYYQIRVDKGNTDPRTYAYLTQDRGLQMCSLIESRAADNAKTYERWGFILAGTGLAGTAGFGFTAISSIASGTPATPNTGVVVGSAIGAGVSALVTLLGTYLVARGSDSWSGFGSADAAIQQMKANDSDGNAALCAAAVQAWTTGRAAADAVSGGGGGGGGGKGGGGAGGGGSGGASASATASAAPAAGAPTPASAVQGSPYATCPSDIYPRPIPGITPAKPPPHPTCGPYSGEGKACDMACAAAASDPWMCPPVP